MTATQSSGCGGGKNFIVAADSEAGEGENFTVSNGFGRGGAKTLLDSGRGEAKTFMVLVVGLGLRKGLRVLGAETTAAFPALQF